MALFTTYRPATFAEMIGNKHVVTAVQALVEKKKVPHSWIFTGNSGTGKTTIARIIAEKLGASTAGIFEINASNIRGIDGVREILQRVNYCIPGSNVTVYILDECHQLTKDAQNALLKVLEDPPKHAYFILATTDPQKLLGTIRTRCEEFKFNPLELDEIAQIIDQVAIKEGIELGDDVFNEIIHNSAGSPRLALNMLERCSVAGNNIEEARKLISGLGIDFQTEGEFTISGQIYGILKSSTNWRQAWVPIATIVDEKILKPKIDVISVKQGLSSILARQLLKNPNYNIAKSVMFLEKHQNLYSNASFIALIYMFVVTYYGE